MSMQRINDEGRLTVGKHKGQLLKNIPYDYLQWLYGELEQDRDDIDRCIQLLEEAMNEKGQ